MLSFIARRLFHGFLILLGVVIVVFFLFYALPGDPISMKVGQHTDPKLEAALRKEFGLDKSLPMQLYLYLRDLSPISIHENTPKQQEKYEYLPLIPLGGNVLVLKAPFLRRSFQTERKVSDILASRIMPTIILALTSMVLATILGILFGIIAALRPNTWLDQFLIGISVIGISVPSFVAAAIISLVFGFILRDYTGLNHIGHLWQDTIDGRELQLKNLILPTIALGIRPLSIIMQLTRSAMLDIMPQDFIRTAKAKGVSRYQVVLKHGLKNALNPVITAISGWLGSLMAGAFFVEYIFNYVGLGLETIRAVETLDLPIIMASCLIIASFFIVINIIVDLLYAAVDPRVRLK